MTKKRLFLIDGSALIYRSHFALINRPLINARGENTSGPFGFINAIQSLLKSEKPDYIAVIFDASGPTFRHEVYSEYKATRQKMPDDLREQLPTVKELVAALGLKVLEKVGFEADDIIGTFTKQAEKAGVEVMIHSGDKDFAQLVSDDVKLYNPGRKSSGVTILGNEEVFEKFGVRPDQIIEYLALVGDTSDNVPGIPKVGPKTASKWLKEFDTVENLYQNLDKLSAKQKEKLLDHKEDFANSKFLVTIKTDVELEYSYQELTQSDHNVPALRELYTRLEFNRHLQQLATLEKGEGETIEKTEILQIDTPNRLKSFLKEAEQQKNLFVQPLIEMGEFNQRKLLGISFAFASGKSWFLQTQEGKRTPSEQPEQPAQPAQQDLFSAPAQQDLFSAPVQQSLFPAPEAEKVPLPKEELNEQINITQLKELFESSKLIKSGHDLKELSLVLAENKIVLQGIGFDIMLASHLENPTRTHDITTLAYQFLNISKTQEVSLLGKGKKKKNWAQLERSEVSNYLGEEIELIIKLDEALKKQLKEQKLDQILEELESPMIPLLAEMESCGLALNIEFLKEMGKQIKTTLTKVEKQIRDLIKAEELDGFENFNVNSPLQVGNLLYEELRLHEILGVRIRKTKKSKKYSTNSEALALLDEHPLPRLILKYREQKKLLSTYVEALPAQAVPDKNNVFRIHTRFRQTGTATGRLSSFSPNLQNIPVRTEQGRLIRKAFIPGPADWRFLSADYSQVELRILAHISNEPALKDAFLTGQDIHSQTASRIFGVPIDKVESSQRSAAKAINFGIIYGMGAPRLAREIDVSVKEAKKFIESYFDSYPKVREYLDDTIEQARERGYVETITGRRRYIYNLNNSDGRLKSHAEHIAVNTPIQGSAADLIKIAMLQIDKSLKAQKLQSQMLLQVHDELLFELPPEEEDALTKLLQKEMTGAIALDVPLVIDIGVASNWADAH